MDIYLQVFFIFLFKISTALDTIDSSQSLTDGNTLISKDGTFEVGFFSPEASTKRYLGIWYASIPVKTVVWVANRDNPINDSSGLLTINTAGIPVILSHNRTVIVWSAPNLSKQAQDTLLLQLLDTGNLVLRSKNDVVSGIYLWQSFDYPCDTLLPGMKLGWDLKTGINRNLSSWKSSNDPSVGDFRWEVELQSNNPQLVMWKGTEKFYISGPWTGSTFSAIQRLRRNPIFTFNFVSNEEEVYYMYILKNSSVFTRIVMNQTTQDRKRYTWNDVTKNWKLYDAVPRDRCDNYGMCGVYGSCNINELPICQCLQGFRPKSLEQWNQLDWSLGCVRNKPLNCSKGDAFVKYIRLKLPDPTNSWVSKTMNLKECEAKCLRNCSCMAYSNADFTGKSSGCTIWFNDLIDFREFPDGVQYLYIRMSSSEIGKGNTTVKRVGIILAPIVFISGMLMIWFYITKTKRAWREAAENNTQIDQDYNCYSQEMEAVFQLATIVNATNNFSINNKIGEGGFGPVFRGTVIDGREIAVKKQSKSSGQGLTEFKNEVALIAKLQHRNLVKLLGCCIQGEEKMLVYEYMPNGSLDSFIFADERKSQLLDWAKRYHIICGIARGLLYLHQDSRLRIIHRDLKASNILLDKRMSPKISDFGMAKSIRGEQTQGSTNRVVGTYGYMAPEYATYGRFSIKSDVFSFGIIVLEIVSGKRSRGFDHPNHSHNLIGHAWELWKEERSLELVDSMLMESSQSHLSEVMRCINVSLLCVQQNVEDRPSMGSVILMLGSEISLPQPKEPGFFKCSDASQPQYSTNQISFSLFDPR
ncbi:G-type lectin S-receptor-like serine/threonine-protein kinase At4g27290 isoform X1 [Euphorbia lathyris]|uniref:G-type lectin S-receptor-like serine/threonine-protein kinase At4g27290 isoform X1 n=2 Tax=Euphorbia lathyris TaxID=212925 RepID=UPI003313D53D